METACLHLRGKAKSSHLSTRCCQERQLLASTDVDVKIVMVNFAKVNAFILNLCLGWNPFIVTIVKSYQVLSFQTVNRVLGMCFPRIKAH